jgi:ATP-dependent DNA helicase RecG
MLVRASSRRRKGVPLKGDGRLRGALKLPYRPRSAVATIAEIEGDLQQEVRCCACSRATSGSGKTLVALMALARCGRSRRAGALAGPHRNPCAPAL